MSEIRQFRYYLFFYYRSLQFWEENSEIRDQIKVKTFFFLKNTLIGRTTRKHLALARGGTTIFTHGPLLEKFGDHCPRQTVNSYFLTNEVKTRQFFIV